MKRCYRSTCTLDKIWSGNCKGLDSAGGRDFLEVYYPPFERQQLYALRASTRMRKHRILYVEADIYSPLHFGVAGLRLLVVGHFHVRYIFFSSEDKLHCSRAIAHRAVSIDKM